MTETEDYILTMVVDRDQISIDDIQDRMQVGLNQLAPHAPFILGIHEADNENMILLKITPAMLYYMISPDFRSQLTIEEMGQVCKKIKEKHTNDINALYDKIKSSIQDAILETFSERHFVNSDKEGIYHGEVREHFSKDNNPQEVEAQRNFIDKLLVSQVIENVKNNTKQYDRFQEGSFMLQEDLRDAILGTFRNYGIFVWDPDIEEDKEFEEQD